jgi:hypothetical protein
LLPQFAQKRQARLAVVHVPGTVLDAEDVGDTRGVASSG